MPTSPRRPRPSVFIGSSSEGLVLAERLKRRLATVATVRLWKRGVFAPSEYPLESLLLELTRNDFGVFLFTPDDVVRMRGQNYEAVRDNVLFETGLFMGGLGRKRTMIVAPPAIRELRVVGDLSGLTLVELREAATPTDDSARGRNASPLAAAATELRGRIVEIGRIARESYDEMAALEANLRHQNVRGHVLFEILSTVTLRSEPWKSTQASALMKRIAARRFQVPRHDVPDEVFWWLVVHGVFTFHDIERFFGKSDHYSSALRYARISDRGVVFLNRLRTAT